jgi:hypothetical protein
MSYDYRKNRIKKIVKFWGMQKNHDLMASFRLSSDDFVKLKRSIKLYICAATGITYADNDKIFLKYLEKARKNLANITPNGGVVPKKEFQIEYNLFLREWCLVMKKMTKNNPSLLSRFRTTPNIRIKFGKEIEANKKRELNTSFPHSDAWVEGPWGMNCFVPILGDINKNNLLYYNPRDFKEEFLKTAKTYKEMQWVLDYYDPMPQLIPQTGRIYISDYALVHKTFRKPGSKTRVSIDTTVFIGNHLPHKDRMHEYKNKIPNYGIDEFRSSNRYEKDKIIQKKSTFSHYTKSLLKTVKI